MKDDRLRIPCDQNYINALGLAAFTFARLEWDAVWCCERIKPNSINFLSDKTAGGIAKKLISLAETVPASSDKQKLVNASAKFQKLVETRNAIVHANPGTDTDGGQKLFRNGKAWSVDDLNTASDSFTECSMELNAMLHGFLKNENQKTT